MSPVTPLLPEMADLLGRGATILTGNQRAARTLRLAFDRLEFGRKSRASGLTTWQPPAIHAWDTWTATLYHQLLIDGHASRVLLNRSQELHLWQSIISSDPQWNSLQTAESLADLACSAWNLLSAYRGRSRLRNLGVSAAGMNADTRSFQRWAQAFVRRCQTDALLSAAELEETLAAVIASGKFAAPASEILLIGFDRQTPAQQLLTSTLSDSGVPIAEHPAENRDNPGAPSFADFGKGWGNTSDTDNPAPSPRLHLTPAEDPNSELRHAALWLRSFLLENPQARVAVIVSDLPAERREIDRVFRQILAPELQDISRENAAAPYEFSLGQPLASIPLAATGLEILRLAAGARPIAALSQLLLSHYFTIEVGDQDARAEFDAFDLRGSRSLRPEISLERLIALAAGSRRASGLTPLLSQLRSLHRTTKDLLDGPAQRSFTTWADGFRKLLESSGWAISARLDSSEFQARRKWESALDELASLDLLAARPTYAEALTSLEGTLQRTLFAPESREAPIQIMSPLEAAGSRFDALWFLRASDLDWPTQPAIHPFLGWRLQHELAMPGSDPALDSAHASRITARLAASTSTVIFSYARQTADGHQRPSPLLAAFNLEPLATTTESLAPPAIALELLEESTFVPLANLTVSGGADILKLQAACGFRAFAEKRLRSAALEDPQPGMDARESGSIVHKALEHLWGELGSQSALRNLSLAERSAHLSRSIEQSLTRTRTLLASDTAATPWDDAYLELQRQRLHRVLTPWLEHELSRAPFEVVFHEEDETATIGPLTLKVRADRVDRVLEPPAGEVIVDYKTGKFTHKHWATERPEEPQLPLYAVLRESGSVAAVAFGVIRAGKDMALHGYESHKNLLGTGRPPKFPHATLDLQIEEWRKHLTVLAQDFAGGNARVLPRKYPETCGFCKQLLLCRLDPATLLTDPDEDPTAEEEYG